ncbi:SAM-dependent methyltransferase [Thermopolyspora sp. NPDC052614]|uniref:SAM-dependent methyltransferase n=1 Tax=Thermopolyspora sp. NPDC052614 TaxID=3155682 RepID=UPI00343482FD
MSVDFSAGLNPDVPNAARIYDYFLGGKNNFPVDRETAERFLSIVPEAKKSVLANRAFLLRVVKELAADGADQFLDIGAGLLNQENVHDIAQAVNPEARVVYVDYDPSVVAHGRALLQGRPRVGFATGDVRKPEDILRAPEVTELIDFSRPVAVLMVALLHFLPDDEDPAGAVAAIRRRLAPGSQLALTHVCHDDANLSRLQQGASLYDNASAPFIFRSESDIAAFFEGFELLEPGLVEISRWRPSSPAYDDAPAAPAQGTPGTSGKTLVLGGVGRVPLPR